MYLGTGASRLHIRLGLGGADVNVIGTGSWLANLLLLYRVLCDVASNAFGLLEERVINIC